MFGGLFAGLSRPMDTKEYGSVNKSLITPLEPSTSVKQLPLNVCHLRFALKAGCHYSGFWILNSEFQPARRAAFC